MRAIVYLRVSTPRQGRSGLGLEAQLKAARDYLEGVEPIRTFTEVETGKRDDVRPKLHEAIALCRLHQATLVIATISRLSRDAHFLLGLQKAGVEFVAADMPSATRFTVGIMAMVAEEEGRMISARTKAAMAAAKARGVKFGGVRPGSKTMGRDIGALGNAKKAAKSRARARDLEPILRELMMSGVTELKAIAAALTDRGIPTARGHSEWHAWGVKRVMNRLEEV